METFQHDGAAFSSSSSSGTDQENHSRLLNSPPRLINLGGASHVRLTAERHLGKSPGWDVIADSQLIAEKTKPE